MSQSNLTTCHVSLIFLATLRARTAQLTGRDTLLPPDSRLVARRRSLCAVPFPRSHPMHPFDHLLPESPADRQAELARILAAGLLRTFGLAPIPADAFAAENPQNSAPPSPDCSPHKSVTVHTG